MLLKSSMNLAEIQIRYDGSVSREWIYIDFTIIMRLREIKMGHILATQKLHICHRATSKWGWYRRNTLFDLGPGLLMWVKVRWSEESKGMMRRNASIFKEALGALRRQLSGSIMRITSTILLGFRGPKKGRKWRFQETPEAHFLRKISKSHPNNASLRNF